MTTEEMIEKLESEIKPTGQIGLLIGTLVAKLEYAQKSGQNALRNLQTVYESIGNDLMADMVAKELKRFKDVLK